MTQNDFGARSFSRDLPNIPTAKSPQNQYRTPIGIKNLQASMIWHNREEEWFFTNKRLIFSTKESEVTDEWIDKFNQLVTQIRDREE